MDARWIVGLRQILFLKPSFIADPVWRNGRTYDSDRDVPGSKLAWDNWIFPWTMKLVGPGRCPSSLEMLLGPSSYKCSSMWITPYKWRREETASSSTKSRTFFVVEYTSVLYIHSVITTLTDSCMSVCLGGAHRRVWPCWSRIYVCTECQLSTHSYAPLFVGTPSVVVSYFFFGVIQRCEAPEHEEATVTLAGAPDRNLWAKQAKRPANHTYSNRGWFGDPRSHEEVTPRPVWAVSGVSFRGEVAPV